QDVDEPIVGRVARDGRSPHFECLGAAVEEVELLVGVVAREVPASPSSGHPPSILRRGHPSGQTTGPIPGRGRAGSGSAAAGAAGSARPRARSPPPPRWPR